MSVDDFTSLWVYDGVGDYHFNRFRVVFECPPSETKQSLADDFVARFPYYLTSQYANVRKGERNFGVIPTLHFHGFKIVNMPVLPGPAGGASANVDIARPHTDWVGQIDKNDGLGFTAQTLKREFVDLSEDLMTLPVDLVTLDTVPAVRINRMHFLAGRRSWRIDDGKSFEVDGDVLVLETTAVERFSHEAYVIADTVIGLESAIPDVWISLLNNFVNMRGLVRVPQRPRPGWRNKDGVDYYVSNKLSDLKALGGDAEYNQQRRLGLFKTLLPMRKRSRGGEDRPRYHRRGLFY
jgi:hypothetical protein